MLLILRLLHTRRSTQALGLPVKVSGILSSLSVSQRLDRGRDRGKGLEVSTPFICRRAGGGRLVVAVESGPARPGNRSALGERGRSPNRRS